MDGVGREDSDTEAVAEGVRAQPTPLSAREASSQGQLEAPPL
jgi:hypothetical protein